MTSKERNEMLKRRKQKQEAYNKLKSGTPSVSYQDCVLAVEYDYSAFMLVPENLVTEELCIMALNGNYSNLNLIQYIPKRLLTNEFVCSLVRLSGVYLKHLPLEVINKEIVLEAAKQSIHAIKYIPKEYKTIEIYKELVDVAKPTIIKFIENPSAELCEYVVDKAPLSIQYLKDSPFLTIEMIKKAITADWKSLKFVSSKRKTKNLCDFAFDINWRTFKFFPDKFKTLERCNLVTSRDVSFIQYCPESVISYEMCEKCLKKRGTLLEFIPEKFKTEELCLLAVAQNHEMLRFVPSKMLSIEMYIKCVEKNWLAIQFVPDGLRNFETYKNLLKQVSFSQKFKDCLMVASFPDETMKQELEKYIALKRFATSLESLKIDYDVLKIERELCIRNLMCSFYDEETKTFTVKERFFGKLDEHCFSNFEDFYLYMDANLNGSNLTEYSFKDVDISKYNLEGAYLCGKLLALQGKYDSTFYDDFISAFSEEAALLPALANEKVEARLITHEETYNERLNSFERKIYYITDIHLNHQLMSRFPNFATYEEIKFFIEKYVRKMVKTACDKGFYDYLLIGGDVSFCFDISEIFYKELCRCWDPSKIVVVLGNHELWDYNRFGKETVDDSMEKIIERYRTLFSELEISFLQNDLLIKKQDAVLILKEKDILEKSVEEIRSIALDSNLILFGGIGFSGYNLQFNATAGIYRQAITSLQKDLYYTQKTETVYNKLRSVFFDDKLIVLSHMHPQDWSNTEPVSNWIYVNGHTHNNRYIQSDKCTMYADNQMGYKAQNATLKYFKTSLCYDVFKYYSDGIYHITKEQYLDFNNGNHTRCTFGREVDYIVMLKRQGVYLFLLEDKERRKLYLLNGGTLNKLENTSVDYYYDHMLKYSNYIKAGMKKYNDALKQISNSVKKIGGDGTVHGCIVDIDFYNHIYLNPQDGCISAYYSSFFGDRYEYPTVEKLLEEKVPRLYANYKKMLESSSEIVATTGLSNLSSETMHIIDTTQYKPSRLIKRLQYMTENNVIRIWNDNLDFDDEASLCEDENLLI